MPPTDPNAALEQLLALLREHPRQTVSACAVRLGWTVADTRRRITILTRTGHLEMRRVYSVAPQEGQS
jgi:predicted ArsR family transcriptional regulator